MSSKLKKRRSPSKPLSRDEKIVRELRKTYGTRAWTEAVDPNFAPAKEFAFHMTDWLEDLDQLKRLYDAPEAYSREEWHRTVWGFLLHVSGHLLRAAELTDTLSDPFEVIKRCNKPAPVRVARSRKKKSA